MTEGRPRRVRARVAHAIPERPPVKLAAGEEVEAGERDTEWPAFVFVTAPHGTGWVPVSTLGEHP